MLRLSLATPIEAILVYRCVATKVGKEHSMWASPHPHLDLVDYHCVICHTPGLMRFYATPLAVVKNPQGIVLHFDMIGFKDRIMPVNY